MPRRQLSQTECLQNQQIVRAGGAVGSGKRAARLNVLRIVNSQPHDALLARLNQAPENATTGGFSV